MVEQSSLGRSHYLDDDALIDRLFDHIDNRTTDLSEGTWREPVENYTSASRLEMEVSVVLRRWPTPYCPSAALSREGSYVARDVAGVPIVAVRARDGDVRVFRNSCRHRGSEIVSGAGCIRSFVCPYHGWSYRLDGGLRHVPDRYGFPELDEEVRGLVPVDVVELGGLVYLDQDGAGVNRGSLGRLPRLLDGDQALIASQQLTVQANWKVLVEGFLEGYHLRATHQKTFLPYGYDNLTVVESSGPHSRVTFPFRRIESLRDSIRGERRLGTSATIVDHVFPNVIVARLSHFTTVVVLEPRAVDETTQVVYHLSNRSGREDGDVESVRDREFLKQGVVEDLRAAVAVQRGFGGGANTFLEFGRFEGALSHFHQQLDASLSGAGWAPDPDVSGA